MSFDVKHRPETLDGVVGQPTDEIATLLNGRWTPNFLFYGPPATGKTTTARAIANEMYGSLESFYEINASDERGVDTIRDRIGKWARQDVGTQATLEMKIPIILLDEMDGLTTEAQQALRSPMEDSKALFILTANAPDNIHPALKSRCETYEFGPVPAESIQSRLEEVARIEGIDMDPQKIQDIAVESNGDMRTALRRLDREHKMTEKRREKQADKVSEFIGDS
mgnify:CR=1 FL=1